jgi:hypothetical protein
MKALENLIYKLKIKHYEKSKKRFLFKRGYVKDEVEYKLFQKYYEQSNKETDFVEFVMTHRIIYTYGKYTESRYPTVPVGVVEIPEMIQGFKDIRKRSTE